MYDFTRSSLIDPCLYMENYKSETHYDATKTIWLNGKTYLNCPFSDKDLFNLIAIINFLCGANIIMILPTNYFRKIEVWSKLACLGEERAIHSVRFKHFPRPL